MPRRDRHLVGGECAVQVPALCQLASRGTGLNTRVGTARFIASLAARLGSDLRPHTAALIKARFFVISSPLQPQWTQPVPRCLSLRDLYHTCALCFYETVLPKAQYNRTAMFCALVSSS